MATKHGKGKYSIAKGRDAENEIARLFQRKGFRDAERRRLSGNRDMGDIVGVPGVIVDVKNRRHMDLSAAMDDLVKKRAAAKDDGRITRASAVIFKRPRKPVEKWYAVLDAEEFVDLMVALSSGGC